MARSRRGQSNNGRPRYVGPFERQCNLILDALRRKPCWNYELVAHSLKYTGRISDLRQWGCVIVATRYPHGDWLYVLEDEPNEVS